MDRQRHSKHFLDFRILFPTSLHYRNIAKLRKKARNRSGQDFIWVQNHGPHEPHLNQREAIRRMLHLRYLLVRCKMGLQQALHKQPLSKGTVFRLADDAIGPYRGQSGSHRWYLQLPALQGGVEKRYAFDYRTLDQLRYVHWAAFKGNWGYLDQRRCRCLPVFKVLIQFEMILYTNL